jgi:hypothetical protein
MDSIVSVITGPSRQATLGVSAQISYTVVRTVPPRTDLAAAPCHRREPDPVNNESPGADRTLRLGRDRRSRTGSSTDRPQWIAAGLRFPSMGRGHVTRASWHATCLGADPGHRASGLPPKSPTRAAGRVGSCRPRRPDRTLTAVKTVWAWLATSCGETFLSWGSCARVAARVGSGSRRGNG